eukprot:6884794-Prymnesium_polylepis.2
MHTLARSPSPHKNSIICALSNSRSLPRFRSASSAFCAASVFVGGTKSQRSLPPTGAARVAE